MDDDEMWDGHRMVDERTRQTAYRVRGARVCDANSNALVYRIRDNSRVVDTNTTSWCSVSMKNATEAAGRLSLSLNGLATDLDTEHGGTDANR
jgi:hypothetical protein